MSNSQSSKAKSKAKLSEMPKAIIYHQTGIRTISDPKQSAWQIIKQLRQYAKKSGYEIMNVIQYEGESRINFKKIVVLAKSNRNVSALIVDDLDRLTGDEVTSLWIRILLKKHRVTVLSVNNPLHNNWTASQLLNELKESLSREHARKVIEGLLRKKMKQAKK